MSAVDASAPPMITGTAAATTSRPGWLIAVCFATAAYLVLELAFNARLLDVVGGGATPQEVDRIEVWGRLISGFALALIFWPFLIKRATARWTGWFGRVGRVVFWSILLMAVMYVGQEVLLRTLVARSSPEDLRTAQHLVLLQSGVVRKVAIVDSLDLTSERLETPDGKATLALLPILGSHIEDVGAKFTADQRAEVAGKVTLSMMGDQNNRMGDYNELLKGLVEGYASFDTAISERTESAWNDYKADLRKRRWKPATVPSRYAARVRASVRRSGVPVADNWRPSDEQGFRRAAREAAADRARPKLATVIAERMPLFSGTLPPDAYHEFIEDPDLQHVLLQTLGYTCIETAHFEVADGTEFREKFIDREVECLVAQLMAEVGQEEPGRAARRALLVPFMALVFSLLGALAHIAKFTLYLLTLIKGYPLFKRGGLFAAVTLAMPAILVTVFAWSMTSPSSESKAFQELERDANLVMRTMIRGTIHGQMVGYPVFEAVRVYLLREFDFGYVGKPPPIQGERTLE